MISVLSFLFILFSFVLYGDKSLSLTDYKIKRICKKEKRESICIKNLQHKKSILQKGSKIELQVIPYKR